MVINLAVYKERNISIYEHPTLVIEPLTLQPSIMRAALFLLLALVPLAWSHPTWDCFGVLEGSGPPFAVYDICGTCNGTNTSCCAERGVAVLDPDPLDVYCCDCSPQHCGADCTWIIYLDVLTNRLVCHSQDGNNTRFYMDAHYIIPVEAINVSGTGINGSGAINTSCTLLPDNCLGYPGGAEMIGYNETCNGIDDDCFGGIDDNPTDAGGQDICDYAGVCHNGTIECVSSALTCLPVLSSALVATECSALCTDEWDYTCDRCPVLADFDQVYCHVSTGIMHITTDGYIRVYPCDICSPSYFKFVFDGAHETNTTVLTDWEDGRVALDWVLNNSHTFTNNVVEPGTYVRLEKGVATSSGLFELEYELLYATKTYNISNVTTFDVGADGMKMAMRATNWTFTDADNYLMTPLRVHHRSGTTVSPNTGYTAITFTDELVRVVLTMQEWYEDETGTAHRVTLRFETFDMYTVIYVFMKAPGAGMHTLFYDPHIGGIVHLAAATATEAAGATEAARVGKNNTTLMLAILLPVFGLLFVLFLVGMVLGAKGGYGTSAGAAFSRVRDDEASGEMIVVEGRGKYMSNKVFGGGTWESIPEIK